jgi:hypothetical protein
MLDAVTAAAEKVAGAAVLTCGTADALGNFVPCGREVFLPVPGKDFGFTNGITGAGRKFLVSAGLFVAYQTVDFCLVGEIEIFVLPPIACMTGCATSLVA